MRSFIPNKKEHKSDYFKVIDSEVKAYILGYIVADGSIEESNRKDTPYWSLHFSYSIKVRKPIYDYLYKDATVFLNRKRNKALNTVLNTVDKRTVQCNA